MFTKIPAGHIHKSFSVASRTPPVDRCTTFVCLFVKMLIAKKTLDEIFIDFSKIQSKLGLDAIFEIYKVDEKISNKDIEQWFSKKKREIFDTLVKQSNMNPTRFGEFRGVKFSSAYKSFGCFPQIIFTSAPARCVQDVDLFPYSDRRKSLKATEMRSLTPDIREKFIKTLATNTGVHLIHCFCNEKLNKAFVGRHQMACLTLDNRIDFFDPLNGAISFSAPSFETDFHNWLETEMLEGALNWLINAEGSNEYSLNYLEIGHYSPELLGLEIEVKKGERQTFCQECGKAETLEQKLASCSKCKKVKYCNQTCQMEDWAHHKKNCRAPGETGKLS